MKTKNPMQLKAFIKKQATEKHISAQLVMQNYMLERLLERISISKYRNNFILKGGFLISAIVGLDTRTTMDLDTTIKGFDLSHDSIESIFTEICSVEIDDDIKFIIDRTEDIREGDDYPGIRVYLFGEYPPIRTAITVDVTTGDKITPKEIEYKFSCLFDDKEISIMAYNLETVLAEKLETILSRGTANTRPRDFYDVFILYQLRWHQVDETTLKKAFESTVQKRGSQWIIDENEAAFRDVKESDELKQRWAKYSKKYEYANGISYLDIMETLRKIMMVLN